MKGGAVDGEVRWLSDAGLLSVIEVTALMYHVRQDERLRCEFVDGSL